MTKTAWISLGTFLVLLVLVFATREDQVSVGVREMDVPKIDIEKITKIESAEPTTPEVKDAAPKSAVLEKKDGAWRVLDNDKSYATEKATIEGLMTALEEFEVGSFVTGRKDKHEELEIDDAKGQSVKITMAGKILDLVFGRSAKGGGNYVRRAGEDDVFVSKGRFAALVKKDVNAWRKRKLLDVEEGDVESVKIGALTLKAEHVDDDKTEWLLEAETPDGFRVDDGAPRRMAQAVLNLRATEFDDGSDVGAVQAEVVVNTKSGSKTVKFGAVDDKKRVQVMVSGDPQVYLVGEYALNNIQKSLDDLRDLRLAVFEPNDAVMLSITAPGQAIVVAKGEAGWTQTSAKGAPEGFALGDVDSKLAGLARVRATKFVSEARAVLTKPGEAVRVVVTMKDGATEAVTFGDMMPKTDDAPQELRQVFGAEDGFTYAVTTWQRDRYAKPFELLKPAAPPPQGMGAPGGMPGLDSLPPEIRKQLEESMRKQGMPGR